MVLAVSLLNICDSGFAGGDSNDDVINGDYDVYDYNDYDDEHDNDITE